MSVYGEYFGWLEYNRWLNALVDRGGDVTESQQQKLGSLREKAARETGALLVPRWDEIKEWLELEPLIEPEPNKPRNRHGRPPGAV